ncbi:MAG TPA: cobalt-precorrin-6A reductase [Devosia sp.]|jgi:precorrin-6A/cobalt-precorrin-6A reductase|uniref:cobalt-precorrin-6A reductase n=1 Tax=Devosia sp. TaxID=1871048 RepID=UPI002F9593D1
MKILILGGTTEARALANRLVALGHDVTTSLAGRTQDPLLPQGNLRMGGFGGVQGLAAYLLGAQIEQLVDATHPFAGQMSRNAVAAAEAANISLLRLVRPAWEPALGDAWIYTQGTAEAAAALPADACVLLTTGHAGLEHFLERGDCRFLVRIIEAPAAALPAHARLLQIRPPFHLLDELALMEREAITHLVTKNSGGTQTASKLEAARRLGVKVIMIARPVYEPANEVASVDEALVALGLTG